MNELVSNDMSRILELSFIVLANVAIFASGYFFGSLNEKTKSIKEKISIINLREELEQKASFALAMIIELSKVLKDDFNKTDEDIENIKKNAKDIIEEDRRERYNDTDAETKNDTEQQAV